MEKNRGRNSCQGLPLKQKADIFARIDQGESCSKFSETCPFSKTQMVNIKKDKGNINSVLDIEASEEIKNVRKPGYPIIEKMMKFSAVSALTAYASLCGHHSREGLYDGSRLPTARLQSLLRWMRRFLKSKNDQFFIRLNGEAGVMDFSFRLLEIERIRKPLSRFD